MPHKKQKSDFPTPVCPFNTLMLIHLEEARLHFPVSFNPLFLPRAIAVDIHPTLLPLKVSNLSWRRKNQRMGLRDGMGR